MNEQQVRSTPNYKYLAVATPKRFAKLSRIKKRK